MLETLERVNAHEASIDKKIKDEMFRDIINALIPTFIALIFEFFFDILNGGFWAVINTFSNSILFSILIVNLLYGILIGITKKSSTSAIILSIVGTVFLVINQIKIAYTEEPISFYDVNFVSNIDGLFNIISGDILILVKEYLLTILLLMISFLIIIRLAKNNEIILNNLRFRIICILTGAIILIFLFIPNQYTKDIFLKCFLCINEYKDYNSYTTNLSYYNTHSLLAGMYGVLLNDRFEEPQYYNEEELNYILENVGNVNIKQKWGQPNIIVIFSESFWDIDKQNNVEFNKVVTPNIKRLKEDGKLIETLSCAYGGMSENVAFELLTGGSLNYFTRGYIPIMSLYKRKNAENSPSIIKELNEEGYKTKVVFGKDYYNSEKTMKKLGFNEYLNLGEAKFDDVVSDEEITDLIIEELEQKQDDEKIFYMTETIQNHMPFGIEKYENYDISIKRSDLTEEENNTILSYAQGVHDADKQLNRLYEYIKEYKESTILIFLGDHLPYLYTENGKNALESISYFNTGMSLEDTYRKYNTQALILSNYNIDTNEIPNSLSNDMLLTYIVNHLDIELSSYYKWLYSTMNYLPASNSYISLDFNGQKYKTDELAGDMKRINELRENMQYKFFVKPTE